MICYIAFATIAPLAVIIVFLRHLRLSAPAKQERVL